MGLPKPKIHQNLTWPDPIKFYYNSIRARPESTEHQLLSNSAGLCLKLQGAELPHVTIYLSNPGNKAAAYVAMSRVKHDEDYLFGGRYTEKHFVPNA